MKAKENPIINVVNIKIYKIFQSICVNNFNIKILQEQFVHIFPDNKKTKRTTILRAIFINPKTPKNNLNPIFPYLSILSE